MSTIPQIEYLKVINYRALQNLQLKKLLPSPYFGVLTAVANPQFLMCLPFYLNASQKASAKPGIDGVDFENSAPEIVKATL